MSDKNNRKIADIYWAVSTQDSPLHSLSHLILTTTGEVLLSFPFYPVRKQRVRKRSELVQQVTEPASGTVKIWLQNPYF